MEYVIEWDKELCHWSIYEWCEKTHKTIGDTVDYAETKEEANERIIELKEGYK